MTLVACGLLALGVLAFMISPMLEGSGRRPWTARSAWSAWSRRDDLLKKKDFIYSSIRELNIDYSMGKLAAEDHDALRQEYMREASDVLDELDRTAGSDLPVEEQIEEAVLQVRQRREPDSDAFTAVEDPSGGDAPPVPAVEDPSGGDAPPVPAVEDPSGGDARPIPTVSAVPPARVQECGDCGTANEQSANFCIECGVSLKRSTCDGCGAENPAAAKFCGQCGEKLT